jgi:hypothetical protein
MIFASISRTNSVSHFPLSWSPGAPQQVVSRDNFIAFGEHGLDVAVLHFLAWLLKTLDLTRRRRLARDLREVLKPRQ